MEAHSSYAISYLGMVLIVFSVIVWNIVRMHRELNNRD